MLVNPNSYIGEKKIQIKSKAGPWNYYRAYLSNIGCETGQVYTLSFDSRQTNNGSGLFSCIKYDHQEKEIDNQVVRVGERTIIKISGEEPSGTRLNFYPDIAGKDSEIGISIFNIKLEEGDIATQYIPNKNIIKADNQAIFLAGGYFKKCIQDSPKGGALC